jgi:hypothetical protein
MKIAIWLCFQQKSTTFGCFSGSLAGGWSGVKVMYETEVQSIKAQSQSLPACLGHVNRQAEKFKILSSNFAPVLNFNL